MSEHALFSTDCVRFYNFFVVYILYRFYSLFPFMAISFTLIFVWFFSFFRQCGMKRLNQLAENRFKCCFPVHFSGGEKRLYMTWLMVHNNTEEKKTATVYTKDSISKLNERKIEAQSENNEKDSCFCCWAILLFVTHNWWRSLFVFFDRISIWFWFLRAKLTPPKKLLLLGHFVPEKRRKVNGIMSLLLFQ